MTECGKRQETAETEAFDFPLVKKRQLRAQKNTWVLADSETILAKLHEFRDKIKWDALRQATTELEVNAALSEVDQFTRERFLNATAILATVHDRDYPKQRPIRFLAESCALAARNNPKSGDPYSPRYSRDICYRERKRRGPAPKPISNFEYWLAQAKLGQRVPKRYLARINRALAKENQEQDDYVKTAQLTYTDITDIHEKIEPMKKKRTTIWLPQTILAKLKNLSATTGAPMAELFRRAVEAYLKGS